jgi:plastocyanin
MRVPATRRCRARTCARTATLAVALVCGTGALVACGSSEAPARSSAQQAVDPATAGTVRGTVTLTGTPPAAGMVRMDGDRACATFAPGAQRPTERYIVGTDGALANVFVYVKSGLEGRSFPIPSEPVVVDQQRCWYVPRVVGVRVGQAFEVRNSDPLLHNVRTTSVVNAPINQGQPVQGMKYSYTFATEEVMVPVKCDVHAWMNAWVGVVSHPYFAVTGSDGAFSLPNLPPGTYTVVAWHEAAGTTTGSVTVTPRGEATLALTLAVPAT